MTAAREVLERLLRRAETGTRQHRPTSLSMESKRDAAAYLALGSLAALEDFHAQVALAERVGAIQVERDPRGDGERLIRLGIKDASALARFLGHVPRAEQLQAAERQLSPRLQHFPVLEQVLATWQQGRKVRGAGPDAACDLADAAHAVAARQADAGNERILRRESVRLFGNSKRLECLTRWLDLLASGELAGSGMEQEHVWAQLDLRREPQPLLLAGPALVQLQDGSRLALPRPWLGLPMEALHSIATTAHCLVSIENLTTFHEAARLPQTADTLVLYTAGMPSPAWRIAYTHILRSLPTGAAVHHWGDIDEGGFRIAALLAQTADSTGHRLQPWRMHPQHLGTHVASAHPPAEELAAMCRWARRAGWPDIAAALEMQPMELEQESLAATLPGPDPN